MAKTSSHRLRIVTYNVHRCRGLDRRTRPERIADVLWALRPDVVALQEVVGAGPSGRGQAEYPGAKLGMGWVMAPTRTWRNHLFGNVVLSRHPIIQHAQHDLTWKTCEPRSCQRATVSISGHPVHVFNVHLGTALRERRYQAGRLVAFVHDRRTRGPRVVLGDFNEWTRGLATSMLSSTMRAVDLAEHGGRRRTYPGFFPVLHLDHIYLDGQVDLVDVELPRTRHTLIASDHLPLLAELKVTV